MSALNNDWIPWDKCGMFNCVGGDRDTAMGDLDTIQIVQRQDSGPEVYQALDYKIDPHTYMSPYGNKFAADDDYGQMVYEAELALDLGQEPQLSAKGTSGCYFIHNRMGVSTCMC